MSTWKVTNRLTDEVARQQSDARIASLSQRLRDTESAITERVSSASNSALAEAALAYGVLFSECRDAYAEMGRAAVGHLEDARTLTEAWPVSSCSAFIQTTAP